MRQLKIDLSELELAFEGGSEMISYYLNLETGEVVSVSDEERGILETIYEFYYDNLTQTVDWEEAFEKKLIPDWQRELLQQADEVEAGLGSRFISIPSETSYEGYQDMEAFIDTVRNPHLYESLERAIIGRGAFRYFKDVLLDFPAQRERWFQFKRERLKERILEWLEEYDITPQQ